MDFSHQRNLLRRKKICITFTINSNDTLITLFRSLIAHKMRNRDSCKNVTIVFEPKNGQTMVTIVSIFRSIFEVETMVTIVFTIVSSHKKWFSGQKAKQW